MGRGVPQLPRIWLARPRGICARRHLARSPCVGATTSPRSTRPVRGRYLARGPCVGPLLQPQRRLEQTAAETRGRSQQWQVQLLQQLQLWPEGEGEIAPGCCSSCSRQRGSLPRGTPVAGGSRMKDNPMPTPAFSCSALPYPPSPRLRRRSEPPPSLRLRPWQQATFRSPAAGSAARGSGAP